MVGTACGAFGHGLDLALTASGTLLAVSAVVGFFMPRSARRRRAGRYADSPVVAAEPG